MMCDLSGEVMEPDINKLVVLCLQIPDNTLCFLLLSVYQRNYCGVPLLLRKVISCIILTCTSLIDLINVQLSQMRILVETVREKKRN